MLSLHNTYLERQTKMTCNANLDVITYVCHCIVFASYSCFLLFNALIKCMCYVHAQVIVCTHVVVRTYACKCD